MTDLRFACRQMLMSPLFTVVAVAALGLGIGAATTAFGAFNTIRLKPLPLVPDQGGLVSVEQFLRNDPLTELGCSYPDYLAVNAQARTLVGLAVMRPKTFILTDREQPERLLGAEISARMFSLLGVQPVLGRDFLVEEEGSGRAPVILLGHSLWQRRYGGDSNLIGRTIQISGQPATVAGVMPRGWQFPESADIWSPIAFDATKEDRGRFFLEAIGRLRPGVTLTEVASELDVLADRLGREYPKTNAGVGIRVQTLREFITRDLGTHLTLLLGAVLFVQLIACANVANLLLARGAVRAREFAVRLALGAPRSQLVRQLVIEGLVLGCLGGSLGFVLALWGRDFCQAAVGRELPFWIDFSFDLRVFAFTSGLALVSVLFFALVPALQTARPEIIDDLREGTRSTGLGAGQVQLRHALVVAEIALALVLLVGAGLMVRSLVKTQTADPGYDARGILTFRVGLPPQYFTNREDYIRFFSDVQARLLALPGVSGAAAVSRLPAVDGQSPTVFRLDGQPEPTLADAPRFDGQIVTPGYFEAMRIPLVAGRDFAMTDVTGSRPVCIVDEVFVRTHFAGMEALGRRIVEPSAKPGEPPVAREIVGVVRGIRPHFDNRPVLAMAYAPHAQWPEAFLSFVVRVRGDPLSLVPLVQREVFAVNSKIPIYNARSMEQVIERHTWDKRFFGGLFVAFAAIALFLAALGIYGVMAYTVGQRTPEIGLRMALGAEGPDVLRLVLRQGARLAMLGMAIGFAASFALARLLESVLFGVSPYDPPIFAVVPILLAGVALAACVLPAWRASRIAPMAALRYE